MLLKDSVLAVLPLREYAHAAYEKTISEVPVLEGENSEEKRRREISYLNIKWFMHRGAQQVFVGGIVRLWVGAFSAVQNLAGEQSVRGGIIDLVQRFFDAHILSRLFLTSIFPIKCFGC